MGTRSPFKPTHLHWLFRVIIDFLTTAMTSLISPLVCHLTQMGSLAAGPDNNSSWYESEIAWIKHLVLFTANVHYTHYKNKKNGWGCVELIPSTMFQTRLWFKKQQTVSIFPQPWMENVHKHNQTSAVNSPFIVQFKLNLRKTREKSTDRFSAGFLKQKQQWLKDYFPFNPGAPA